MIKHFTLLIFSILFFSIGICGQASLQPPATEVRAVWLATNWSLDWPSADMSIDQQKKEMRRKLDALQRANFNTVLFQTRIRGDVFYRSAIEPVSPFFRSSYINSFDPLAFVIEECHRRGMECHAWFVTFPVGSKKQVERMKKTSVVSKNKGICKLHKGEWYLDPGNPEARKYILSLVSEIVSGYDIDGIHFDYIRYPENAKTFPDNDTYKKYGKGMSLDDWRRSNINTLVTDIYKSVKKKKKWVQVSSSPLGRYRPLPVKPNDGWTAYADVFQDAGHWLRSGAHDAIFPMMYYKEELFYPFLEDWMEQAAGRLIVPGLGAYMMNEPERNWSLQNILDQVDYARQKQTAGQAFYRTETILSDSKDILTTLSRHYYQYPAKLPPLTWLSTTRPAPPKNLEVFKTRNGTTCLQWEAADSDDEQLSYTVYRSFADRANTENSESIVITGLRQNKIFLCVENTDVGIYYSVTASDRFHNESEPCVSAFYVHSTFER
ncbi:uncharacterized lipoprotein YddW (UPF0748 family) [Dysgonomonas sp. PH5-45]|uniref:glycoside hydrolase family 10 protein n=1 Tax=unclassified Dysgonomonas TaxID=2630389 RepID=UPI0024732CFC|nr:MULTISPECIES: family 10 glycosylhydrolase [unclassified Dysgonomonas]MDH6355657.1 uncharacterized lipoprotein YddW (UPF0748 family) [Dysgonomonas sp. PH5-45]MDH6388560.1 uncharacterized lipoprotein YddW (UPF0748 family) [Dysgonomonas sp. PH5-37]